MKSLFEKIGGTDTLGADGMHYPDQKLSEEIALFGRLHRDFLKEKYPARYNELILSYERWSYLADVNERAQERLDAMIAQMKVAEGITEELKVYDQMKWVFLFVLFSFHLIINNKFIYITIAFFLYSRFSILFQILVHNICI